MLERNVIQKITNGVCAVGYLSVPLKEYRKDLYSPHFHVIGTGFMVSPTTVITNRHVIDGIAEDQAMLGFPDEQFFLSFIVPDGKGSFRNTLRMIRNPAQTA